MTDVDRFLNVFPRSGKNAPMEGAALSKQVEERFGVPVPAALTEWWTGVGAGYFADRELYVFPSVHAVAHRSFLGWNAHDMWRKLFPPPHAGGPLFFAENCFGHQVGFRWQDGVPIPCLLDLDRFEMFRVADVFEQLFSEVFSDRYAFTDPPFFKTSAPGSAPCPTTCTIPPSSARSSAAVPRPPTTGARKPTST